MDTPHVTVAGAFIAVVFLIAIVGVIGWMLHLPEETPTTLRVARAVRHAERANRILVPVQGTALSDRMVALGAQMAKARDAQMEVYYVIVIPWTLPIDADLPKAEAIAKDELERASRIATRYGVPIETSVAHVREPGPAIVDEALRTGADIILMGDIPERPGETRFSATTNYVFSHAPCEVILDRPGLEHMTRERAENQRVGELLHRGS